MVLESLGRGGWRYETRHQRSAAEENQNDHFPSHLYYATYVAFVWNNFRATRIRLHEVLLRCIALIFSYSIAHSLSLHLSKVLAKSRELWLHRWFSMSAAAPISASGKLTQGEKLGRDQCRIRGTRVFGRFMLRWFRGRMGVRVIDDWGRNWSYQGRDED